MTLSCPSGFTDAVTDAPAKVNVGVPVTVIGSVNLMVIGTVLPGPYVPLVPVTLRTAGRTPSMTIPGGFDPSSAPPAMGTAVPAAFVAKS